jgi:hypothetical protein
MKNNIVKSSFYFSAYPLKAITGAASPAKEQGSPYLRAVLKGKPKLVKQGKVLPMINPYDKQFRPAPFDDDKLPKDIELVQKNWFNNYE